MKKIDSTFGAVAEIPDGQSFEIIAPISVLENIEDLMARVLNLVNENKKLRQDRNEWRDSALEGTSCITLLKRDLASAQSEILRLTEALTGAGITVDVLRAEISKLKHEILA